METTATTTQVSGSDKEFMTKAAHAGYAEVEAGKMALEKSENEDVRQFAQRMIDDHTKAGDELKKLAENKGVSLPTEPSEDQKETANELSELESEEFDSEYMDAQVSDHETVIGFFEDEARDGSDSDVIAFADKTLPTLKSHLEMAENISGNL